MSKAYQTINVQMDGEKLAKCKNANMSFKFRESDRFLVKGHVETSEGRCLKNAGVEVIRTNLRNQEKDILGVVFTDENGNYSVSLQVYKCYGYVFKVYSPVN